MKITHLSLEDSLQSPQFDATDISPGLNVLPLSEGAQSEGVVDLLHALLYGRGVDLPNNASVAQACGLVELEDAIGRFRLRRRWENNAVRLTIASLDNRAVPEGVVERLLCDLPAGVADKVFHANGRRGDQLGELLSEQVALAFQDLAPLASRHQEDRLASHRGAAGNYEDRSRLIQRRDELSLAIEQRLAERRARSAEAEREIQEIEAETERLLSRREQVDRRRLAAEAELAGLEARLRYAAIADTVRREADHPDLSEVAPQLEELDQQIERWRATLAELELRESHVRSELALIHPDDASPTISLADQRAGLSVAGRLLHDLEGEVARLARAADSQACVCHDAHPRINPLVETLSQQIARLTDLASQQQLALEAQQFKAEAEHLSRSQADLQRQLDHLLNRRQELHRSSRSKTTSSLTLAELEPTEGSRSRAELETELAGLTGELKDIKSTLERLDAKRRDRYHFRSNPPHTPELDTLQRELDQTQRQLRDERDYHATESTTANASPWRASELLARVTDGQWVGLRLVMGGRELTATDRNGRQVLARELPPAERRLAALALRLSLAWTAGDRGLALPLVLDEPFAGLDALQAARLATALDDLGRAGRQLFVSTNDADALHRFSTLGSAFLRRGEPSFASRTFTVEETTEPAATRPTHRVTARTVDASEYLLSPEDDIERFPAPIRDRQSVFARSRIHTIADLLGADPSAVAEELDRDDVTAELVALWQTHLGFVCFVPHMTFEDAMVIAGAGYLSTDDLADANEEQLDQRITDYLDSDHGRRLSDRGYRFDGSRGANWISQARQGRERWRSSNAWSSWSRHRGERRNRVESNGRRSSSRRPSSQLRLRTEDGGRRTTHIEPTRNGSGATTRAQTKTLKFYLETSSPIVDAPSIGPKTAKKFEAIAIRTVSDLLSADPEAIAAEIDSSRIDAETIVAWQHQAELVCRVPQLRGHDAQILVGCGFTRPEEIASMKPAELFGFIEPFCQTAEGQRILRKGKAPDLAEVSDWINWSRQCRVLGAA